VHLAGHRVDVAGHGGNAEGDGTDQVGQRDPPGPGPGTPGGPAVTGLVPGQQAGDQEADRADPVRPPDVLVRGLRGQVTRHGDPGADVEVEGPDELDRRGPPVDPAGLAGEDAPVPGVLPRGRGVDGLPVAKEGSRGKEQGADEVRDGIPPVPDGVRIPRHRPEREQQRSDGEQDGDPPAPGPGRPPGRSGDWLLMLAVAARFPADHDPVLAYVVHPRRRAADAAAALSSHDRLLPDAAGSPLAVAHPLGVMAVCGLCSRP